MSLTGCVGHHPDDEDRPSADVGLLCGNCYSRLRSSLLELVPIAGWLAVNVAAGGSAMGDRVTGTREDPIPLRTDILDLIGPVAPDPSVPVLRQDAATWDQLGETSIFDEVRSWCALVETEAAEDGQDFTWEDRRTLTGAVAYLTGHLSWVAAQPWVDELIAAVRKLARDAHRVAPWRAETMRDTEPCDRCGVRAVVLHVAESTLVCERRMGGCGKATVSDYLRQSRRAG